MNGTLLPERIDAHLAPDEIVLRRRTGSCRLAVSPDPDAPSWYAALAALDRALHAEAPRHPGSRLPRALATAVAPRLHIVLAGQYARWLLLPWQAEIASPVEVDALARLRLREIYGDTARHWQVSCAERPPGEATPVCAIDKELLDGLRALAAQHGCRLESVRPLFAAAADHWRKKLPRGVVWFGLLDKAHLSLGLLHDRRWLALHSESIDPADHAAGEAIAGLMARSALAAGVATDAARLLLCGDGAGECVTTLPGAAVSPLGAALPWLPAAAANSQRESAA
ncbi:hypothetical protein [Rhodocyclus tenuis]|uniref:Uncharacterized protein n=1 Tax=Rhodocyclus tenuis TaxID=1066 RepID=A0A840G1N4_RHOTE|nr:hypothetical protein [Rhodocyclus tenuis]MBB4248317.1 hypothetical protein [Rhodocyclus tenuis]